MRYGTHLITIRQVPYEGELLPAGQSGSVTGEGDFPGSYRVLLENDAEVELTPDQFMTTEQANAATP